MAHDNYIEIVLIPESNNSGMFFSFVFGVW